MSATTDASWLCTCGEGRGVHMRMVRSSEADAMKRLSAEKDASEMPCVWPCSV